MNEKEVKKKAEEILDLLEKHLVYYVKDVIKNASGISISDKDAEMILAKLGKRYLVKAMSR